MGILVLARHVGEEILIGDDVVIRVNDIRGGIVRIGIKAPNHIRVDRAEVRKQLNAAKEQP